jgi:hypothetical protein
MPQPRQRCEPVSYLIFAHDACGGAVATAFLFLYWNTRACLHKSFLPVAMLHSSQAHYLEQTIQANKKKTCQRHTYAELSRLPPIGRTFGRSEI